MAPAATPGVEVTVIAGALGDTEPPAPPADSYAAQADADVAIWHIVLDPGATWTMPAAAGPDTVRTLYVFEGDGLEIDGDRRRRRHRRTHRRNPGGHVDRSVLGCRVSAAAGPAASPSRWLATARS